MTAVDSYPHDYPDYDLILRPDGFVRLPIPILSATNTGRLLVHVTPGPMPEGLNQERHYGRHSRWNTRAAKRSDPRRYFKIRDTILDQTAGRRELRRTGRPLTTRSAS